MIKSSLEAGNGLNVWVGPPQGDIESIGPGEHEQEISKLYGSLEVSESAQALAEEVCVMLFSNRSGSSLICDYMRATGKFSGMGEPLNHPLVVSRSESHGIESFYGYLEWLMTHVHEPNTMFGMKASADQALMLITSGAIPACYGHVNWLVAKRRDVLAQAVSHSIAAQTGQWASFHDGSAVDPEYSYSDIKTQVLSVIESNRKIDIFCDYIGIDPVEIFYEDFLINPPESTVTLADSLGIKDVEVDSAQLRRDKQAGSRNREFIERFKRDLERSRWDQEIRSLLGL
ncbi:Stf0 family sulfotransferase [Haliea salexigens]|uniref:Stf0 family sulfotransferase n=1 Tax=Haliea salexigens TaxID=287487 RepID=UPI000484EEE0|nr:Stf0 family sulfotransferase [Haliea salexigens]